MEVVLVMSEMAVAGVEVEVLVVSELTKKLLSWQWFRLMLRLRCTR